MSPSEAPVNGVECPGLLRLLSFLARVAFAVTLGLVAARGARAGRRSRPSRPSTCARCRSPCRSCASRSRPRSGPAAPRRTRPAVARRGGAAGRARRSRGAGDGARTGRPRRRGERAAARARAAAPSRAASRSPGRDLARFPLGRRVGLALGGRAGASRSSGRYELWVEGRGRVSVSLDGRVVLEAEGDPLRAEAAIGLAAGAATLDVRFEHTGPGPRLRLGWTRPDGRRETIPARYLGRGAPRVAVVGDRRPGARRGGTRRAPGRSSLPGTCAATCRRRDRSRPRRVGRERPRLRRCCSRS